MTAGSRGFQHLRLDVLELDGEGSFDRTTRILIIRRSYCCQKYVYPFLTKGIGMRGPGIDLRGVSYAACTGHASSSCVIIQSNRNHKYRFA